MADSKVKGPEVAASEADQNAQVLAGQNAQVGDPKTEDSPAVPTNQNNPALTEGKSARLGTDPEPDKTVLPSNVLLKSSGGLKIRVSVSPAAKSPGAAATAGKARSAGGPSPSSSQAPARLRLKAPPQASKTGNYLFGSCFGSPTTSSLPLTSGKVPPARTLPRKPPPSPSTRRGPPDPQKPGEPPAPTELEKKDPVPDPTSNNNPAAEPAVLATVVQAPAPSGAAAAPVLARSPSCRCSITTVQAEIAGQSLPLDPGSTAAGPASMSKEENDPGISSGQQILNAQAEELIAAVQRADEESARQAAAGVSPIRGLRRNRSPRRQATRRRHESDEVNRRPGSSGRERRPYEGRSRSPHNYNYDPGGYSYNPPPPPSPEPVPDPLRVPSDPTTVGIEGLFAAILGREDNSRQYDSSSRSPRVFRRFKAQKDRIMRDTTVPSTSAWVEPIPVDQEIGDNRQYQSLRDPTSNNPAEAGSIRDQAYPSRQDAPEASSSRHHQEYIDYANLPGTSNRDQFSPGETRAANTDQANDPGTYVDARAALDARQEEREANLLASDHRFKMKDPNREVKWKATPKEPRQRGRPDPSFSPRPGDIIIRARKRAGLRLTDFYYYDNENYMERGDQILRAKFDYLPGADRMYLWCRLYVYAADGTYTFLDTNSDFVEKFKTHPVDVATFKDPTRFLGKI